MDPKSDKPLSQQEYWQGHFEKWSASGLSQLDYCKRERLKIHTFRYWRNREGRLEYKAKSRLRLVPISHLGYEPADFASQTPVMITVTVRNLRLEFPSSTPANVFSQFIRALEG